MEIKYKNLSSDAASYREPTPRRAGIIVLAQRPGELQLCYPAAAVAPPSSACLFRRQNSVLPLALFPSGRTLRPFPRPLCVHAYPSNSSWFLLSAAPTRPMQLSSRYSIAPHERSSVLSALLSQTPSLKARYVSYSNGVIKLKSEGDDVWSLGSGVVTKVEVGLH